MADELNETAEIESSVDGMDSVAVLAALLSQILGLEAESTDPANIFAESINKIATACKNSGNIQKITEDLTKFNKSLTNTGTTDSVKRLDELYAKFTSINNLVNDKSIYSELSNLQSQVRNSIDIERFFETVNQVPKKNFVNISRNFSAPLNDIENKSFYSSESTVEDYGNKLLDDFEKRVAKDIERARKVGESTKTSSAIEVLISNYVNNTLGTLSKSFSSIMQNAGQHPVAKMSEMYDIVRSGVFEREQENFNNNLNLSAKRKNNKVISIYSESILDKINEIVKKDIEQLKKTTIKNNLSDEEKNLIDISAENLIKNIVEQVESVLKNERLRPIQKKNQLDSIFKEFKKDYTPQNLIPKQSERENLLYQQKLKELLYRQISQNNQPQKNDFIQQRNYQKEFLVKEYSQRDEEISLKRKELEKQLIQQKQQKERSDIVEYFIGKSIVKNPLYEGRSLTSYKFDNGLKQNAENFTDIIKYGLKSFVDSMGGSREETGQWRKNGYDSKIENEIFSSLEERIANLKYKKGYTEVLDENGKGTGHYQLNTISSGTLDELNYKLYKSRAAATNDIKKFVNSTYEEAINNKSFTGNFDEFVASKKNEITQRYYNNSNLRKFMMALSNIELNNKEGLDIDKRAREIAESQLKKKVFTEFDSEKQEFYRRKANEDDVANLTESIKDALIRDLVNADKKNNQPNLKEPIFKDTEQDRATARKLYAMGDFTPLEAVGNSYKKNWGLNFLSPEQLYYGNNGTNVPQKQNIIPTNNDSLVSEVAGFEQNIDQLNKILAKQNELLAKAVEEEKDILQKTDLSALTKSLAGKSFEDIRKNVTEYLSLDEEERNRTLANIGNNEGALREFAKLQTEMAGALKTLNSLGTNPQTAKMFESLMLGDQGAITKQIQSFNGDPEIFDKMQRGVAKVIEALSKLKASDDGTYLAKAVNALSQARKRDLNERILEASGLKDLDVITKSLTNTIRSAHAPVKEIQKEIETTTNAISRLSRAEKNAPKRRTVLSDSLKDSITVGLRRYSQSYTERGGIYGAVSKATANLTQNSQLFNVMGVNVGGIAGGLAVSALAKLGKAIKDLGNEALDAFGNIQTVKTNLGVVYGSQSEANSVFDEIKDYAVKSPFGVKQVSEFAVLLKQSGVYNSDLMKTLQQIGDVAGGNAEKYSRIANNYAQIIAAGKATSMDLRQFANAGLPIYRELKKELGVSTTTQVRDMTSKGLVTNEVIERVFDRMTSEGGTFYNAVNRGAKTYNARRQNLADVKEINFAKLGEGVYGYGNNGLAESTSWLSKIFNIQEKLYDVVGSIGDKLTKDTKENQTENRDKRAFTLRESINELEERLGDPTLSEESRAVLQRNIAKKREELSYYQSIEIEDETRDFRNDKYKESRERLDEQLEKSLINFQEAASNYSLTFNEAYNTLKRQNLLNEDGSLKSAQAQKLASETLGAPSVNIWELSNADIDSRQAIGERLTEERLKNTQNLPQINFETISENLVEDSRSNYNDRVDALKRSIEELNQTEEGLAYFQTETAKINTNFNELIEKSNGKSNSISAIFSEIESEYKSSDAYKAKEQEEKDKRLEQAKLAAQKIKSLNLTDSSENWLKSMNLNDFSDLLEQGYFEQTKIGTNQGDFRYNLNDVESSNIVDISKNIENFYNMFMSSMNNEQEVLFVNLKKDWENARTQLTSEKDLNKREELFRKLSRAITSFTKTFDDEFITPITNQIADIEREISKAQDELDNAVREGKASDEIGSLEVKLKDLKDKRTNLEKERTKNRIMQGSLIEKRSVVTVSDEALQENDTPKRNYEYRPFWERLSTNTLGIPADVLRNLAEGVAKLGGYATDENGKRRTTGELAAEVFKMQNTRKQNESLAKQLLKEGFSPKEIAKTYLEQEKKYGRLAPTEAVNQRTANNGLRLLATSTKSSVDLTKNLTDSLSQQLEQLDTFFSAAFFRQEDSSMMMEGINPKDRNTKKQVDETAPIAIYGSKNEFEWWMDKVNAFSGNIEKASDGTSKFTETMLNSLESYREHITQLRDVTARLGVMKTAINAIKAKTIQSEQNINTRRAEISGGFKTGTSLGAKFDSSGYAVQRVLIDAWKNAANNDPILKAYYEKKNNGLGALDTDAVEFFGTYGTDITNLSEISQKMLEKAGLTEKDLEKFKAPNDKLLEAQRNNTEALYELTETLKGFNPLPERRVIDETPAKKEPEKSPVIKNPLKIADANLNTILSQYGLTANNKEDANNSRNKLEEQQRTVQQEIDSLAIERNRLVRERDSLKSDWDISKRQLDFGGNTDVAHDILVEKERIAREKFNKAETDRASIQKTINSKVAYANNIGNAIAKIDSENFNDVVEQNIPEPTPATNLTQSNKKSSYRTVRKYYDSLNDYGIINNENKDDVSSLID
ncbi:MAG: tape measure protein, partial [Bacteroidales bacterium]|nr:tape measure protein [Candidatus Scybalousia scybalohippi]